MDLKKHNNLHYIGPDLSAGAMPALFYFALSGVDSLTLAPINAPVAHLESENMRIFSCSLPNHKTGSDRKEAMSSWTDEMLLKFFDMAAAEIEHVLPLCTNAALAGLSRGAFVACHLAARLPIQTVLGFAPLTRFGSLNVENLNLTDKVIRFYIGNCDELVGTENTFNVISNLAKQVKKEAPFELIISPSIGHKGHGTSQETFVDGANWVRGQLL